MIRSDPAMGEGYNRRENYSISVLDSGCGNVDNKNVKNCCVISIIGRAGKSIETVSEVISRASGFPDVTKVVLLKDREVRFSDTELLQELGNQMKKKPEIESVSKNSWTIEALMEELSKTGTGFDDLFFLYGDTPLIDPELALKMYGKHRKYFVQYTFADGYPYGLAPEILKTDILSALALLARGNADPPERDVLFTVIQKDINSFDIETEISPKDLRYLRISLTRDTKLNSLQLDNIIAAGGKDTQSIVDLFPGAQRLLRTVPACYQIQITGGCPQTCSYCPYPSVGGNILDRRDELSPDLLGKILRKFSDFSGEAVIGFGLWGEPALHSRIVQCVSAVLAYENFSLVIETSGIGWKEEVLAGIKREMEEKGTSPGRLHFIVSLDAVEKATYKELRGSGMEEALGGLEILLREFPETVYVQAVRMLDNEEEVERFYKTWKARTDHVIVQKYDHFAGFLPSKKVTDLSPLHRYPCWHLKRDFCVLIDGTVPLCREDLKKEFPLGNIFEEDCETIWKRGEARYLDHVEEKYGPLCDECDEYYTYNF